MALRLVDIYLPTPHDDLPPFEEKYPVLDRRTIALTDERKLERVLLNAEDTEAFVEWLHDTVGATEDYRIILTPVEATLPRPEPDDEENTEQTTDAKDEEETRSVGRISREELYQDIQDSLSVTRVHFMLVALSTIVAAGGMLRDSVAVVIGAMVIAPLIGPNIALAFGTTLADGGLLRRSLVVNLLGLLLGFVLALGIGLALPVDPSIPEIAARTSVGLSDVALALAAGVAGTLSVTRGVSTALIGVMVAVALLPPLVALGMLVGAGYWAAAQGAGLLTLTNVVAINLAGVSTFLAQGVRPMSWYEAERAKTATRWAIGIWLIALGLLVAAMLLADTAAI
jgi:uncharacterized hydrophobic protein (TIGR00341 family)